MKAVQDSLYQGRHPSGVLILDFGSQYTQLIARRIRELRVYSEIVSHRISPRAVAKIKPQAIILSGGPASVTSPKSPSMDLRIFEMGLPILGICYGMQIMAKLLGGGVKASPKREYGSAELQVLKSDDLFQGLPQKLAIWMSHGDRVIRTPRGFKVIGKSRNSPIAAIANHEKRFYGLQFHPEVVHTKKGKQILRNFIFNIANCKPNWTMSSFIENTVESLRDSVNGERVVCAVSGGVDSTVLAAFLHRAIRDQLAPVFIDNGLLRLGEAEEVTATFKRRLGIHLKAINGQKIFLSNLKGVSDPEQKRKIIGKQFIRLFEREAKKIGRLRFLAQGTLYPDVIESRSAFGGPSSTIKTHHNVGGLPEKMHLELIEPFRELFKDEVRKVGEELGLPDEIIWRHPFPGPGLAVRILGDVTQERLRILRQADAIFIQELKSADYYRKIWQALAVLLPIKTVGVMGDERTYENVVALRAVTSKDGMTADWARLPHRLLQRISGRIINEVKGINRVVYDTSSKPPSTIEWE
jgi:GMP synthase (glutamine-hydrolysing)